MYPIVYVPIFVVVAALVVFFAGIRIVRPTHRGLVERLGKYRRFADRGFNWVIPGIDRLIQVNITEQMVSSEKREIITADSLNAVVDSNVYFKVKHQEHNLARALVQFKLTESIESQAAALNAIIGDLR